MADTKGNEDQIPTGTAKVVSDTAEPGKTTSLKELREVGDILDRGYSFEDDGPVTISAPKSA